ncbi:MAG: hypothetical protein ABI972_13520 [Acidobacteriota bacterium]
MSEQSVPRQPPDGSKLDETAPVCSVCEKPLTGRERKFRGAPLCAACRRHRAERLAADRRWHPVIHAALLILGAAVVIWIAYWGLTKLSSL